MNYPLWLPLFWFILSYISANQDYSVSYVRNMNIDSAGDWGPWEVCPPGHFFIKVKVEEADSGPDQEGVTGVAWGCYGKGKWKTLTSGVGSSGKTGNEPKCPGGMSGVSMALGEAGRDRRGIVGLEVTCNSGKKYALGSLQANTLRHQLLCPDKMKLCGIRTKSLSLEGQTVDNQGLTSMAIRCCDISSKVDGGYTPWSEWSACTHTCGNLGRKHATRSCTYPSPDNGGAPCVGSNTRTISCPEAPCPIDGNWGWWGSWGGLPTDCSYYGKLYLPQYRNRMCDNPSPNYGGANCHGNNQETRERNAPYQYLKSSCSVDFKYGEWGQWSGCSATCGAARRTRYKICHPHKYGGKPCPTVVPEHAQEHRRCTESLKCRCSWADHYFPGSTFKKFWHIANWEDCQLKCMQNRDCKTWMYQGPYHYWKSSRNICQLSKSTYISASGYSHEWAGPNKCKHYY